MECIDNFVTSLGLETWIMDSGITELMSSLEYVK